MYLKRCLLVHAAAANVRAEYVAERISVCIVNRKVRSDYAEVFFYRAYVFRARYRDNLCKRNFEI